MDERKRIGLIYQYNENWIGGTYYILNIIRALNKLDEPIKPFLTIYYNSGSSLDSISALGYKHIEFIKFSSALSVPQKVGNILSLKIFGTQVFKKKLPANYVENFYFKTFDIDESNIGKYFFWIADLQDLCLPQFFRKRELDKRIANYNRMVKEKQPVVFSSNAALADFDRFFPGNSNLKKVLPFVSITDSDFKSISIGALKVKFGIKGKYFICSNQFWRHKNHIVVLKAFALFVKTNPEVQLVFTGKEHDYRDPDYTNEVKAYASQLGLDEKVLFLGFIDRDEQLKLMEESICIVQPSLFEGWSTTVEDAKFLNQPVICSDIAVHREQLPDSALFFTPADENQLLEKLNEVTANGYEGKMHFDYEAAIKKFGEGFLNIFN
ncbi:glycosyltransferase family 4 protein [Mucilaginibacter ximonensis]|uniref:Glycosyltransferase family 4 protein n=1 Tax=Mucilaginibacter ximonensis TaxID=538021 RepID=A0ABW5YEZ4_9SPHI